VESCKTTSLHNQFKSRIVNQSSTSYRNFDFMTAGIDLGSSNCNLEVSLFSRKLAVASSGLLLLPQGRGSSDSNTDFSREPPQAHGTFWSGLGSRWPWAQILPGSRQSVLTISKPISHMNLRAPPGLKFFTLSMQVSCNHNRKHILSF
jgi:hypothetical protein